MKIIKIAIITIITILLTSCQNFKGPSINILEYNTSLNTIDYVSFETKYYKMLIPKNWEKNKLEGIDSFVIELLTSDKDTVYSDFGWYSNNLTEFESPATKAEFFLIDNYKAKIIRTNQNENNIVGVYIANLWKEGSQMNHFNLYGAKLSQQSANELMNVVGSIKFKKP